MIANKKDKFRLAKKKSHSKSDLNITSLMDILTILLVFMLKNVAMDASQKNAPEGMFLPTTTTKDKLIESGQAILIKIFSDKPEKNEPAKILFGKENIYVGTLQEFMSKRETRENLFNYLKLEADEIINVMQNKPCLLIQADKELKCRYITEFIIFSANAAFANIYFSSIHADDKNEVLGI